MPVATRTFEATEEAPTDDPYGGDLSDDFLASADRARRWDKVIEWIETGLIKPGAYSNFLYHEFMSDPWSTIRKTYRELGLPLTEEGFARMKACLDAKPQGIHSRHSYAKRNEDDPVMREERRVYQRYQAYFGVPNE